MFKKLLFLVVILKAVSLTVNAAPLPANFVQNVTLLLSVVVPGKFGTNFSTVNSVTVTTRLAIEAFGLATSNNFSATAQLQAVAPITLWLTNNVVTVVGGRSVTNTHIYGYLGNPAFRIKDGANIVDVSQLFTVTTDGNAVASSLLNKTGGYVSYKSYRVRTITVSNGALAFTGQGFVVSSLVNVPVRPGVVVVGVNDNWTSLSGVANNGVVNGVLHGSISATFEKLE